MRHQHLKRGVSACLALVLFATTLFASGFTTTAHAQTREWDLSLPSLAEAFEDYFLLGNIYPGGGHTIPGYTAANPPMNPDTMEMFIHHYNAITAENWHKPQLIAPGNARPERFNFNHVDRIVDFAVENDIALVGHALVWHSQTPNWMFRLPGNVPLTRQEARDNMEFYIRTLSEHFASRNMLGAVYSWDVANEVIASGVGSFSGDWRNHIRPASGNPWLEAYMNNPTNLPGHPTDYIYDAFIFARRYFPYSILYYNDYNEQQPGKREAIAQMVEYFNERWAHDFENNPEAVPQGQSYTGRLLIEGIGMQSHYHALGNWTGWGSTDPQASNVRLSIERFVQTGTRVSITELDITLGAWGTEAIPSPTAAQWRTQAEFFERVFGYYLEFADYIPRVSLWGLADSHSWRRNGHPLLFDAYYRPKPAFYAIHQALANFEAANGPRVVYAPSIDTASLPSAMPNQRYTTMLEATRNNWAPILWTVYSGSLPSGLVLHSRTGVIEGTPTSEGVFNFAIAIENSGGRTVRDFTLVVGDVPVSDYIPSNDIDEVVDAPVLPVTPAEPPRNVVPALPTN